MRGDRCRWGCFRRQPPGGKDVDANPRRSTQCPGSDLPAAGQPRSAQPGEHLPSAEPAAAFPRQRREGHRPGDSTPKELREGVEIIGAPLLSKVASEDLVYRALHDLAPAGNTIRIAVGHGHTESRDSVADPSVIDVARLSELAQQRVVDYVALGDTHSAMPLRSEEHTSE